MNWYNLLKLAEPISSYPLEEYMSIGHDNDNSAILWFIDDQFKFNSISIIDLSKKNGYRSI